MIQNTTDATSAPRTLVLSDRYLPDVGGSFTWFHNVYTRYPPGTVWILTNRYPDSLEVDRLSPQVHMVRTRLRRYPFLRPESLILYAKMLAVSTAVIVRRGIRLVHAGKNLPEGLVASILRRRLGVPYLVYAHGEEITVGERVPRWRRQLPRVYGEAAAVIANSRFTRDLVRALGVEERRIAVISPGVDPRVFVPAPPDPELRRRYQLDGKLVLLTVGRLQRRKGHDRVIQALPRILREAPDLVYVIAGDGEEESALRRLAGETGVTPVVRFLGRVSQTELVGLYQASDIFIMASRLMPDGDVEGFGIVYLEAGACGKPVIAGDSGGTADAVREGLNGLRVDGDDPAAIAGAVVGLARDPERRARLGMAGRRLVESEYSWDAVTAVTRRLSSAVVAGALDPANVRHTGR